MEKVVSTEPLKVISTITIKVITMASQYSRSMLEGYMLVVASTIAHIGARSVVLPRASSPRHFLTPSENLTHRILFLTAPSLWKRE